MKKNKICSCFLLAFSFLLYISCSRDNEQKKNNTDYAENQSDADEAAFLGMQLEDSNKADDTQSIHSFEFLVKNNSKYITEDITGTIYGNTITLRVPVYTDRSSLIPTITYSGKSVTPGSDKAVNFSKGNVIYTVMSGNGTFMKYKVIIQNRQLVRTIEYLPKNNLKIDPHEDEIIGYAVPEYHKNGVMLKYTEYYSNGEDGIWFNDDDGIHQMNIYNRAGDLVESYSYNNPGPDGVYHTQDDVYNSYAVHLFDKNGKEVEYIEGNSAGNDGIWLTEDDGFSALHAYEYEKDLLAKEIRYSEANVISCYYIYNYNKNSRVDTEWKYKGPGNDKKWFTDDDELEMETTYRYDESGNILREAVGHDKYGNVSYWYSYSYNPENKIIERIEYNNTGSDNLWFTDDDIVNSRAIYEYNRDGQPTLTVFSNSPGEDEIWFNGDDDIHSYIVQEYTKSTETYTYYYWPDNSVGSDGLWFTADDIPRYKIFIRYIVINNVRKDQETYIISYGAGKDRIWFTEDDVKLYSYMKNRFDRYGNPLGTTYYNGAGRDGIWVTDDDIIDYYTVSIYE
jgi:hypothetical protein